MVFSSADYPLFLLAVFTLYMLLRAGGRVGNVARLLLLLLLGDLVYLILVKDVGRLWDPLGGLVYRALVQDAAPMRPLTEYIAGSGVFIAGVVLGLTRAEWMQSDRGQSVFAVFLSILLAMLSAVMLFYWQGDYGLSALTAELSHHGHLFFLGVFGVALGAGMQERGKAFGRVVILFIASLIFYHAWAAGMHGGYMYLAALIIFTIVLDYYLALAISRAESKGTRRLLLIISLITNLGVLAFFKYLFFFATNMKSLFGLDTDITAFKLILPAGISFHTFQSLSYTIDVYKKKVPATRSLLNFATYVLFFPQLVAGPIVRAHEFLPQISNLPAHHGQRAADGLYRIMVGLFKKLCIADIIAVGLVDRVFADPGNFSSIEVLFAVYGYAFQIYLDFSAYSDIAIGSAQLFGFKFPENFETPYRSSNLQEFWRRWHITLSSWLRDYLYIPLGGSRGKSWMTYKNLMITMLLGGLWHGASWTFIVWGFLHGGGLAVTRVYQRRAGSEPALAARYSMYAVVVAAVLLPLHILMAGLIGDMGRAAHIDPMWFHLIFAWLYVTPAWAATVAWLSMESSAPASDVASEADPDPQDRPETHPLRKTSGEPPKPARRLLALPDLSSPPGAPRWPLIGFAARIAFLLTTAGIGLMMWYRKPLGMLGWGILGLWLLLACVGTVADAEPSRRFARRYSKWAIRRGLAVILTFHYVCLGWVFFRAVTFGKARDVLTQIYALSTDHKNLSAAYLFFLGLALASHLIPTGTFRWVRDRFVELPPWARAAVIVIAALLLRRMAAPTVAPFIYFQF